MEILLYKWYNKWGKKALNLQKNLTINCYVKLNISYSKNRFRIKPTKNKLQRTKVVIFDLFFFIPCPFNVSSLSPVEQPVFINYPKCLQGTAAPCLNPATRWSQRTELRLGRLVWFPFVTPPRAFQNCPEPQMQKMNFIPLLKGLLIGQWKKRWIEVA